MGDWGWLLGAAGGMKASLHPGTGWGRAGGIQPYTQPSAMKIKHELSHGCITSAESLSPNPSA